MKEAQIIALADLGYGAYGALDTAMVETAVYVLRKIVDSLLTES